jgi:uncharacterized protein YfaT (DUF1175 family)
VHACKKGGGGYLGVELGHELEKLDNTDRKHPDCNIVEAFVSRSLIESLGNVACYRLGYHFVKVALIRLFRRGMSTHKHQTQAHALIRVCAREALRTK